MQEVAFFHRAAKVLIVADMLEHFCEDMPLTIRLVARLAGMYRRPITPPDWRATFRDKAAAKASIERILEWDFERIILAHGRLIEADGRAVFEKSFKWLLRR